MKKFVKLTLAALSVAAAGNNAVIAGGKRKNAAQKLAQEAQGFVGDLNPNAARTKRAAKRHQVSAESYVAYEDVIKLPSAAGNVTPQQGMHLVVSVDDLAAALLRQAAPARPGTPVNNAVDVNDDESVASFDVDFDEDELIDELIVEREAPRPGNVTPEMDGRAASVEELAAALAVPSCPPGTPTAGIAVAVSPEVFAQQVADALGLQEEINNMYA